MVFNKNRSQMLARREDIQIKGKEQRVEKLYKVMPKLILVP